ncbi:MAG: hypothetical protein NVS3B18_03010 [Candidatus Dormibacteria bacterium]
MPGRIASGVAALESGRQRRRLAAPGEPREPRWPASLAVVAALALYLILPDRLVVGPKWVVPALEVALLLPLTITTPHRHRAETRFGRLTSLLLVALINAANVGSLVLLVHFLLAGGKTDGRELILSSIEIYLTNVLIFGLWYWELDQGGPGARLLPHPAKPDFLFPQQNAPQAADQGWKPGFVDYLYVSFTNATAFSPTDTMPLRQRAKLLMGIQAAASLITVALVAARAVNILS